MNVLCSFCREGGFAFLPLGGSPNRNVWIPCPFCEFGSREEMSPRVKAILDEETRDWRQLIVAIPEQSTPQQSKRMMEAIFRSFYRGITKGQKKGGP